LRPRRSSRMAKTYEKSKGDIRAVMTTMIYSPEFWSRSAFRVHLWQIRCFEVRGSV
jgi:uncharacterized protein (DUF1800 family)